jgi:hypothetical protein
VTSPPAHPPGPSGRPFGQVSRVRRYGPVLLIVAALVAAGVVATVRHGGNTTTAAPPGATAGKSIRAGQGAIPLTYAGAVRRGVTGQYRWGPGCDTRTGLLKIPTVYAAPCVPLVRGDNGGSTWGGVSKTAINVVDYQPPPGGLGSALPGATGSPAANLATARSYVTMLNHVYELYGRHVNLILYRATGQATDAVAAQADAVRVAEQIHAFASIGGPAQTTAYEDELARLHVLCIDCGLGDLSATYQQDAPYLWGSLPASDTLLRTSVDYVIKQLNGRPAIWAGNRGWHTRRRQFAFVNYVQSPPSPGSEQLTEQITRRLRAGRVSFAIQHSLTYTLDLNTLPDQAATIAAKLKASNATTVIFAGDPIMPIYLTKAAAAIGYYPEWVITGTVFTATTTLARFYNQSEWAHAFGISSLPVPTPVTLSDAYRLYSWWYGGLNAPPSPTTAQVILPPILQLFEGLQLAGPHLTPSTFAAGMFGAPKAGGGPTAPLQAYGDAGAPPTPSYTSQADYTFVWYNASAKGASEQGAAGTGLITYVQGGQRYPAGTMPAAPVPMFSASGAVTSYPALPRGDRTPAYPPWPGSPAAGSGVL